MASEIRMHVLQVAKAHQLLLHPTAMAPLVEFAAANGGKDRQLRQQSLMGLFSLIADMGRSAEPSTTASTANGNGSATSSPAAARQVTADHVKKAVEHTSMAQSGGMATRDVAGGAGHVTVVRLEDVPTLMVDEARYAITEPKEALDRTSALRQRYFVAYAQALRSDLFSRAAVTARPNGNDAAAKPNEVEKMRLLSLTSLEGTPVSSIVTVLGVITKNTSPDAKTEWLIEDPRLQLPLNIERGATTDGAGFYVEGALFLVTGTWNGHAFSARKLAMPLSETRDDAFTAINGRDLFGLAPKDRERAAQLQAASQSSVIVVMSHVHLDQPSTLENLERFCGILEGQGLDLAAITIVLVGNFTSKLTNVGDASHLDDAQSDRRAFTGLFDKLGNLLHNKAPNVAQKCGFVFVPGPHDPVGPIGTFPRPPLPQTFTERVRRWCPKAVFAPNPCRLRFFNHEVVISRHDYLHTLRRDNILPCDLSDNCQTFDAITRTVIGQSHLFPGHGTNVLWKHDHALRSFPLPHTLLLCDKSEQWETRYKGCQVANPGSFSATATFLWYTPADGAMSFNSVPQ